jgi:superkiller protein 3
MTSLADTVCSNQQLRATDPLMRSAGFATALYNLTREGICRSTAFALLTFVLISCALTQSSDLSTAKRLFASGSYDKAAGVLETSLKSYPQDSEEHLLLGQVYALQDRRTEAIEQFTKTIELEPRWAIAYNMLGMALNRFAEFQRAHEAFAEAVALDPDLALARLNLAMSLAQAGEATQAADQLQAAIRIQPNAPTAATAHYLLAKIFMDNDSQRARDELTAAVRIQPSYQEAWIALGRLLRETNEPHGALDAFKHAVACDPRDYDSQYELGSEELEQDNIRDAVVHLQLARKATQYPTVGLLYKLDRALRKEGETAKAQAVRFEAQALLAQDTAANQHFLDAQRLDHDGMELEAHGETSKAVEKYRDALELNPQQDGFRLHYALALCRLNRWHQGIGELNEILLRDPSNIEARHALYIALDKAKQQVSVSSSGAHP